METKEETLSAFWINIVVWFILYLTGIFNILLASEFFTLIYAHAYVESVNSVTNKDNIFKTFGSINYFDVLTA